MTPPETSTAFPHLFSPLQVGAVTLKNRIISSGHDTVMAENGQVTDRLIAYHEARAAGGAGLIVLQVSGVHETAKYTYHVLMADSDDGIPGYQRLAETVHNFNCKIFGQLFHGGREIMESQDGSLPVSLAPSAVPNERFHVMPRAMPQQLIDEVVAGYGAAARRLQTAGLDGAEIVASHGYLPAQFLNPRVNQRSDQYGGSDENRLRFLREVLQAVRAEVGDEFVVGLRVSASEETEDGLTVDEVVNALTALESDESLDYISVVAGTSATLLGSDHIVPPMNFPAAYTAPLSARVKQAVGLPVMVAGRINQPHEGEQVIESGQADAVAMTRAMICDPVMPNKAAAGLVDEIRACIGCNQACIGHFHAGYPISCIQHPETGREQLYGIRMPVKQALDIMVVGGGVGGMKAAVVAAERGHRVTLYEATKRVGGQVLLAEQLPGRAEFGGAITNLLSEIDRYGVKVVTNVRVGADLVREQNPDAVVVATGAVPHRPALELLDDPTILDAWEVINGAVLPSGRIVVADWRCDWIGLGVAQMIAEQGRKVTLAVDGYMAGQRIQQYVRDAMTADVLRAGVDILTLVRPYGADTDTVYLQHVLTGEPVIVDGVSALVLSQGHDPVTELSEALLDFPGAVHSIGDCLSPRTVEEAVLEGLQVASAL
ncbi:MAG TPA: FAD-dependent oxidoreductase [Actinomycetes bacterium]|nr:FAD-dependent oxidoreductase [Actinomycetes bacterium]